jgi:hypothetical protein
MEENNVISKFKPFVLGQCRCPCKESISIRTKKGLLQTYKHGHFWKVKENNPSKKGAESIHWKGGLIPDKSGYMMRYMPDHPFANGIGYVREHRLVMEKHLGRYLTKQEVIHHKNDIKDDNRLENLEILIDQSNHATIHNTGQQRAKKDMSKRWCSDPECPHPDRTYVTKKGYEFWYKDKKGGFLCHSCNKRNRERGSKNRC